MSSKSNDSDDDEYHCILTPFTKRPSAKKPSIKREAKKAKIEVKAEPSKSREPEEQTHVEPLGIVEVDASVFEPLSEEERRLIQNRKKNDKKRDKELKTSYLDLLNEACKKIK